MSKREIRLPYPHLSVRIRNEEIAESFIYTLLYTADTILYELGIREITEENVGEIIRMIRLPIFHMREIRNFVNSSPKSSDQPDQKGKEEGEGGNTEEDTEDIIEGEEAEQGFFVSQPRIKAVFEYPLVEEELQLVFEITSELFRKLSEKSQSLQ